jgi:hypothetical protein
VGDVVCCLCLGGLFTTFAVYWYRDHDFHNDFAKSYVKSGGVGGEY